MIEKEKRSRALNREADNMQDMSLPDDFDGQAIYERIRQSAEQVEIPESLSPENILEKCKKLPQQKVAEEKEGKKFRFRNPKLIGGLSAAAVFLICCISLRGMMMGGKSAMEENAAAGEGFDAAAPMEEYELTEESAPAEADGGMAEAGAGEEKLPERKNAGELYTLAGSYEAVYERLEEEKSARENSMNGSGMRDGAMIMEDAVADLAEESAFTTGTAESMKQESLMEASGEAERYSETNVQTFGIDESDVVKTDGEYLYLLRGSSVSIISTGEEMKQIGEVRPETGDSAASVCAMYVDGDKMVLMLQEYTAGLAEEEREDPSDYDLLYIEEGRSVSVLTYDIGDKEHPVLTGKVTQDGSYVTSRKDGNLVYLFTGQYLLEDYGKDPSDAIPEINARKVAEDCIYMGDRGERALLISSISLYRPEEVRDAVMILDEGSEIYMGENSLYLYRTNYRERAEITEIAKFSLTGGFLNGEGAATLRGMVRDTFAIHEKDHKLRVLTTDMSGADWENCLFLLNEDLKVTGKLEHIAVGESIYAARYLGDMAYFITYRNMDPLFAADLSDERNPKLVGELEITGFSEYLHFWGEDKLLGLGFETDPKTGQQKGLKLVMFDMADPAELKVLGSKVLQDTSYSPALYDYKTILADPGENLIGFLVESYDRGVKRDYELYQWNGEGFERILSENLDEDGYDNANYRGMYIGEKFYIAHPEVVRYYDRENYERKQVLKME